MDSFVPAGFASSGLLMRSAKEPPPAGISVFSADMAKFPTDDAKGVDEESEGGVVG